MHGDFDILVNLAVALPIALVLGYITHRLRLSPIVGYLLAGVVVGPQTPWFVADAATAAQFAEIGVILLMFGVGLHFDLSDLLAVRRVAIPGAIGQVAVATVLGALAMAGLGFGWGAGIVMGVALSVASTVVLIRVLTDNDLLHTEQGHVAVGWLIVEDIFTVLLLVVLPAMAPLLLGGSADITDILRALGIAIAKVAVLAVLVLWGGRYVIAWLLRQVARTRSRELFTLAVLSVALTVATGAAATFGVSMALGAFLAGMVVGRSEVSHQAAADALPMQDAFAVLFFVSVGLLFEPATVVDHPGLFLALLAVVLVAKPLTAALIVWALAYPPRAALTIALALAQVGEFSFILAKLAAAEGLLSADGQSLIIACAIVSITINPVLFRVVPHAEAWLRARPALWRRLSRRSEARRAGAGAWPEPGGPSEARAVIVGFGPVGKFAARILREFGFRPVIVDTNVDTVRQLVESGESAVYGDATRSEVLVGAGVEQARYLLVTIPSLEARTAIIILARELNPSIQVFVRARYLKERVWLEEVGATEVTYEEAEAAIALASLLLHAVGASEERVRDEIREIREELALRQP